MWLFPWRLAACQGLLGAREGGGGGGEGGPGRGRLQAGTRGEGGGCSRARESGTPRGGRRGSMKELEPALRMEGDILDTLEALG